MRKVSFLILVFLPSNAHTNELSSGRMLIPEISKTFPKLQSNKFIIFCKQSNEILIQNDKNSIIKESDCSLNFTYKSSNNIDYECRFSSNENNIENVKKWLDQFFLFKIQRKGDYLFDIPVLYNKQKKVSICAEKDIWVLISEKHNKNIIKTIRYKTILSAPLEKNSCIGWIIIRSPIFNEPYFYDIRFPMDLEKSGKFSIIKDSINYLIFGPSYQQEVKKDEI